MCFKYERRGILDRHGFARNRTWIIDDSQSWPPPNDSIGRAYVDLLLKPSEMDLRIWPHRYKQTRIVMKLYDLCPLMKFW